MNLLTESRRAGSAELDLQPTAVLVARFLDGEVSGLRALQAAAPQLQAAVDAVVDRFGRGGRLIYVGAGTAGRLGWLDAVECVPTFDLGPERVIALLAGGPTALLEPIEGGEDDPAAARQDISRAHVCPADAVVAISASGATPYTLAAAEAAHAVGALTVAVVANPNTPLAAATDLAVEAMVGPEFVAGSTRLKAGTAQKVTLNALSTLVMIRCGRTYGDLMVDLRATNDKLRNRARRVVAVAADTDEQQAARLLHEADGEVKTAIVMALRDLDPVAARDALRRHQGRLRAVLDRPADTRTGPNAGKAP
ncbi:MAG: N-acetylmuramic acid 6-phosphate etherase [Marmoricola sp.]